MAGKARVLSTDEAQGLLEERLGMSFRIMFEMSHRQDYPAELQEVCRETFNELYGRALDGVRKSDLKGAQDRLETVVENNPEINPDRIAVPSSVHDKMNELCKSARLKNLGKFFKGLILTGAGIIGARYFGAQYSSDPSPFWGAAYCTSVGIAAVSCLSAIAGSIKGIVDRKRFGQFYTPLSEREKQLADYVYWPEKK